MKPIFDTNILIDYLNGISQAAQELTRYPSVAISSITWIEVMAGAASEGEEKALRGFLGRFSQIQLDRQVAEHTLIIRRQHRIRLPDAIIWASARASGTLLVTRNTHDFPESEPDIRVPYRL